MRKFSIAHDFGALLHTGDRVVDVGAGTGDATRIALQLGAHVVACEPDRRRDPVPGATWLPVALGDQFMFNQRLYLGVDGLRSSLTESLVAETVGSQDQTPVLTLDAVTSRAEVVKVDAQGWDARVLRGGRRVLAGARTLVVEVWPHGLHAVGDTVAGLYDLVRGAGFAVILWGDRQTPVTREACVWHDQTGETKHGDWVCQR